MHTSGLERRIHVAPIDRSEPRGRTGFVELRAAAATGARHRSLGGGPATQREHGIDLRIRERRIERHRDLLRSRHHAR